MFCFDLNNISLPDERWLPRRCTLDPDSVPPQTPPLCTPPRHTPSHPVTPRHTPSHPVTPQNTLLYSFFTLLNSTDEAAQAVEPSALIPLKFNPHRVVMVGDPCQLPATVFSRLAKDANYGQSLFQVYSLLSPPSPISPLFDLCGLCGLFFVLQLFVLNFSLFCI